MATAALMARRRRRRAADHAPPHRGSRELGGARADPTASSTAVSDRRGQRSGDKAKRPRANTARTGLPRRLRRRWPRPRQRATQEQIRRERRSNQRLRAGLAAVGVLSGRGDRRRGARARPPQTGPTRRAYEPSSSRSRRRPPAGRRGPARRRPRTGRCCSRWPACPWTTRWTPEPTCSPPSTAPRRSRAALEAPAGSSTWRSIRRPSRWRSWPRTALASSSSTGRHFAGSPCRRDSLGSRSPADGQGYAMSVSGDLVEDQGSHQSSCSTGPVPGQRSSSVASRPGTRSSTSASPAAGTWDTRPPVAGSPVSLVRMPEDGRTLTFVWDLQSPGRPVARLELGAVGSARPSARTGARCIPGSIHANGPRPPRHDPSQRDDAPHADSCRPRCTPAGRRACAEPERPHPRGRCRRRGRPDGHRDAQPPRTSVR